MDEPHHSGEPDRVPRTGIAVRQHRSVLDGTHRLGSSTPTPQPRSSPPAQWGRPAGRPCGIRPPHGPGLAPSLAERDGL